VFHPWLILRQPNTIFVQAHLPFFEKIATFRLEKSLENLARFFKPFAIYRIGGGLRTALCNVVHQQNFPPAKALAQLERSDQLILFEKSYTSNYLEKPPQKLCVKL
jgi:hypothetical protein